MTRIGNWRGIRRARAFMRAGLAAYVLVLFLASMAGVRVELPCRDGCHGTVLEWGGPEKSTGTCRPGLEGSCCTEETLADYLFATGWQGIHESPLNPPFLVIPNFDVSVFVRVPPLEGGAISTFVPPERMNPSPLALRAPPSAA